MAAIQPSLFTTAEDDADAKKPNLLNVGGAYVMAGRLDWGDVVLPDASGPPRDWRERICRAAREHHRGRRVGVAELVAGAGVPEPAAAAYAKGMWFVWRGPNWSPVLTDDNLACILTWLGLPEPRGDVEPL